MNTELNPISELLNEIGEYLGAEPAIGRAPTPMRSNELSHAINLMPATARERQKAIVAKQRVGYTLDINEQLESASFGGDDSGYDLADDGEYGYTDNYDEAASVLFSAGFSDQW